MIGSLGSCIVSGLMRFKGAKTLHLWSGIALLGLTMRHYTQNRPKAKKTRNTYPCDQIHDSDCMADFSRKFFRCKDRDYFVVSLFKVIDIVGSPGRNRYARHDTGLDPEVLVTITA